MVVGGGLVGAAIAYGLAKRSRRVAMFDEGDQAVRAARGNFGLIWVQGKGIDFPTYAAWTRASAQRWSELAMLQASMYEGVASELLQMGVKVPDEG